MRKEKNKTKQKRGPQVTKQDAINTGNMYLVLYDSNAPQGTQGGDSLSSAFVFCHAHHSRQGVYVET